MNFPKSLNIIEFWGLSGTSINTLDLTNVTSVGAQCFTGCHFKNVIWGDSLTAIYDRAFWSVTFDEKVIIPSSVNFIDVQSFLGSNMTECEFLCNLAVIPDQLFMDSTVKKVTFTHNVTKIGKSAFQNCSTLTSIIMPESVGWSSVTEIGDNAFNGCSNWKETIELGNCSWNKENSFFNCPVNINKK